MPAEELEEEVDARGGDVGLAGHDEAVGAVDGAFCSGGLRVDLVDEGLVDTGGGGGFILEKSVEGSEDGVFVAEEAGFRENEAPSVERLRYAPEEVGVRQREVRHGLDARFGCRRDEPAVEIPDPGEHRLSPRDAGRREAWHGVLGLVPDWVDEGSGLGVGCEGGEVVECGGDEGRPDVFFFEGEGDGGRGGVGDSCFAVG